MSGAPTWIKKHDEQKARAEAAEALYRETDEWLGEALVALGAKDVFGIKEAKARREAAEASLERVKRGAQAARDVLMDNGLRPALQRRDHAAEILDAILLDTEQEDYRNYKDGVHPAAFSESGEGEARCPNCGSDDPTVGGSHLRPTNPFYCPDPFHSPQPDSDQEGEARLTLDPDEPCPRCGRNNETQCSDPNCPIHQEGEVRCSCGWRIEYEADERQTLRSRPDRNCPVHPPQTDTLEENQ